jgi:hypothetical protein
LYGGPLNGEYDGNVMRPLFLAILAAAALLGQDPAPAPPAEPPPPAETPAPAEAPAPAAVVKPPAAPPPPPIALTTLRTVYLLPLPNGFDQYLANHLARTGAFEVVVDAALADAVITAQLGETFEEKLKELYPRPEDEAGDAEDAEASGAATSDRREYANFMRGSSFSRGKGNVFVVDPRARRVIWSTWLPPRSTAARDLDRTARSVVKRLEDDLKKQTAPGS